jgi:uncharacterized RmlC-like cupin family protein
MSERLRVIHPGERVPDTGSGAMVREAAVSREATGAKRLWLGHVVLPPGMVSGVHHHAEAESGIYVVSGHARFVSGDALDRIHDADPGDFVWVPPREVHVEMNLSDTEPVVVVVARSTTDALVVNLPTPGGWIPPR